MSRPEFEPRRFRSTVPYYARYRLSYPPELIARVIDLAGLAPGAHVMDLGCGPGLLGIQFAKAGMRVMAVDPEPDMLEAGRSAAREAGVEVDFRQGSSFDLPATEPLALVAMGRSFHWMDRAEILRSLNWRVVPSGAIALFEDNHPRTAENKWLDDMREIENRFGADAASHRAARRSTEYRSHLSYLLESHFSHLVRVGVYIRQTITADDIVGRAFSLSVLSHETLGGRAADFERELRGALGEISADGRFTEIAELAAIVAMRV